ncbi:hypothetical protein Prudu_005059 [Prunus dulcis]|uniref:Uncharacterized protein n=1 Tax=Prunus dulcis TaxID=3755 RepID=A0A4Y1QWR7_PRUDU|nr:hypothetical protein Prudu_005059 [Prunus dulcis]
MQGGQYLHSQTLNIDDFQFTVLWNKSGYTVMANGALDLQLVWFKNTKMMIVFDPLDRAEAMEHPRRDPPIFLAKCQLSWKGLVNFSIVTVYVEGFLPSPVGLWVEQLRYNCRGMGYWEQRMY